MKKIVLTIGLTILAWGTFVYAQTKSVTTYHPSPHGVFDYFQLVPRELPAEPCQIGSLVVNDAEPYLLKFCIDDGNNAGDGLWANLVDIWTQVGDDIYPTDTSTNSNLQVGVGTSTPSFRLHLDDDAGIIATGSLGSGDTLPALNDTPMFIWYPRKAALLAGSNYNSLWDDSLIGDYSTVAGGFGNAAYGDYGVVSGGTMGIVLADHTSLTGGGSNSVDGQHASILGGSSNSTDGTAATISGGENNDATGSYATIGGGQNNIASGDYSVISSGAENEATGSHSVIVKGGENEAFGNYSVAVGNDYDGWCYNWSTGDYSTTLGDCWSGAEGAYSTNAGYESVVYEDYSFNMGGWNLVHAQYASAVGEVFTVESNATYAMAAGQQGHTWMEPTGVSGYAASVIGGEYVKVYGDYSMGGGTKVTINETADRSFAWQSSFWPGPTPTFEVNNPDVFVFSISGFGIRDMTPDYPLDFYNNARFQSDGDICTGADNCINALASDIKLKKDIHPLTGALETIAKLKGYTFQWRPKADKDNYTHVGFIAQEAGGLFPSWVTKDFHDHYVLDPKGFEALFTESLRELNQKSGAIRKGHQELLNIEHELKDLIRRQEADLSNKEKTIREQEQEIKNLLSRLNG